MFVRFDIRVYVFFILKLFVGLSRSVFVRQSDPRPVSVPVVPGVRSYLPYLLEIYLFSIHLYDKYPFVV